jgi:hypothetical protein
MYNIYVGAFLRHRENFLAAYYHSDTFVIKKKRLSTVIVSDMKQYAHFINIIF